MREASGNSQVERRGTCTASNTAPLTEQFNFKGIQVVLGASGVGREVLRQSYSFEEVRLSRCFRKEEAGVTRVSLTVLAQPYTPIRQPRLRQDYILWLNAPWTTTNTLSVNLIRPA
jgi:hypothetical protein